MKTKVLVLRPDVELTPQNAKFFFEAATFKSVLTAVVKGDLTKAMEQLHGMRTCDVLHEEEEPMFRKGDILRVIELDDRDPLKMACKLSELIDFQLLEDDDTDGKSEFSFLSMRGVPQSHVKLYEHVPEEINIPITLENLPSTDTKPAL
jgi:hypothetical protein